MSVPNRWRLAGFVVVLCAAFAVDRPVARWMADAGPATLRVFGAITWFGQGAVILYPAGLVMLAAAALGWQRPDPRGRAWAVFRPAATIFAVVAAAGLANDALKIVFGRARPHLWLNGDASGFHFLRYAARYASFPSGHTATSTAAAIVFSALFPRSRGIFIAFACLIGLSRIVLDAHYVSDVIAGAAVGGLAAQIMLDRMREWGWT
jgi:membrane-associated phospholipid phosphatase